MIEKKQFEYIRPLGVGGTGDAGLFFDYTTDMFFAFKKYNPKEGNNKDECYKRFVDEVKILFTLSHPNIVRVYNYYLYPEYVTGYLQMEFIKGIPIDEYVPWECGKEWTDIFEETISAFTYLEENKILHRDIRPSNILVDKNQNIKIIDFGFGKKLTEEAPEGKSIFLNWPVTENPIEIIEDGLYHHQTEIFFVGKLFQHIIEHNKVEFKLQHIIEKMVQRSPENRYTSFIDISKAISEDVLGELDFSRKDKKAY